MENILTGLEKQLKKAGFKSSFIPVERLADLRSDLDSHLKSKRLNSDFFDNVVSRYSLFYNFGVPENFPGAKSVIVTAVQSPKIRVNFNFSGKIYPAVIPPTYTHETDALVLDTITDYLKNKDYTVKDAVLPAKMLAVRSGLAKYGRNNVTYIEGWGSYCRLRSYYTDIPCTSDNWQDYKMMESCKRCKACMNVCPAKTICSDRFLVRAERCLTYFNEGIEDFPEWIDPAWHNCLIGCMICQDICPANKDFINYISDGPEFKEEETENILKCVAKEKLQKETVKKLKKLYMWDDYYQISRNLNLLIKTDN